MVIFENIDIDNYKSILKNIGIDKTIPEKINIDRKFLRNINVDNIDSISLMRF